jgi:hypothetical protein
MQKKNVEYHLPDQSDQGKSRELTRRDGMEGFIAITRRNTGGFIGTRLKYIKGEWIAGTGDNEVVLPVGTKLCVDMNTLHMGFVKWEDCIPVDAVIVRVADGGRQPELRDMPDRDKSQWPVGKDGRVKDPWSPDQRVYMVAIDPPHEEFTFVSSSWGGRFACQDLCADYVTGSDEHPGEMLIVALGTYKRPGLADV